MKEQSNNVKAWYALKNQPSKTWDETLDEHWQQLKSKIFEYNEVVSDDYQNKKNGIDKFFKFINEFNESLESQKRQREIRDHYKQRDIDIKADYQNGMTTKELAKKYQVSISIIRIALDKPDSRNRTYGKGKHRQ